MVVIYEYGIFILTFLYITFSNVATVLLVGFIGLKIHATVSPHKSTYIVLRKRYVCKFNKYSRYLCCI